MIPVVSVIIANYNSSKYIEAALESALHQTLRDIEVIVVDDCSTDGCVKIISEISQRDHRVRLFTTQANTHGPSIPRNRAIQEARGAWIAVMDLSLIHI